jgi:hypothetical protein
MKVFSHKPYTGDTQMVVIQVPSSEIGYINSVTEAYEGMAIVRTRDEIKGIIEFWVIPELIKSFDEFLDALSAEIPLRRLTEDNA